MLMPKPTQFPHYGQLWIKRRVLRVNVRVCARQIARFERAEHEGSGSMGVRKMGVVCGVCCVGEGSVHV